MWKIVTAKVAVASVPYAVDRPYDYLVPESLVQDVAPGKRVMLPFGRGNRRNEGLVLAVSEQSGDKQLKCIESVLDQEPVLDEGQLKLALWMRERFFCTVYDAARAMLPAGMWFKDGERRIGDKTVSTVSLDIPPEEAVSIAEQKKLKAPQQSALLMLLSQIGSASVKELLYFTGASRTSLTSLERAGFVRREELEVFRRPRVTDVGEAEPIILNAEQQSAYDKLKELLCSDKAEAALLYGVTGSGKTPVYIRLINDAIDRGRTSIVLVPEIALTPQLMRTFASYFGDRVAMLHSALSMGERYDEWKRIRSGSVRVVIGTRSAIFAPVKDLGLIILDEEQEGTYKSENAPRYHARDVAKYRCAHSGALLVLGSATPDIESMYSAKCGKYRLFRLEHRYNEAPLPPVIIVDMKKELLSGRSGMISAPLEEELRKNIAVGEQSILFLNRRGASTLVTCGECGFTHTCPRCSVSLTYHSANRRLMCHYCGYSEQYSERCPECGGQLKHIGAGTQKIEQELRELFPDVEIVRMDTDTVTPLRSHDALLSEFSKKNIPILLGTQMVTKGLDFENVTLVGVLSADQMLYVNDYRAHERTFSLITQVVGRSGRGHKQGRAVIQTFTPENEVIRLASRQDYDGFYEREIQLRSLSGSPPVNDLFTITASGVDENRVLEGCVKLRAALSGYLRDMENIRLLGPAPASVTKINNRFRYRISLSCTASKRIRDTISHVIREFSKDPKFRGVSVYADVDPYD